ncbi:hypothetical protein ACWTU6_10320 [Mesorhizobium sp. BHbsci]
MRSSIKGIRHLPSSAATRQASLETELWLTADWMQTTAPAYPNSMMLLCIEEERVVARDNTVAFARLRLQVPHSRIPHHSVKAAVKIRHYPDGTLAVFYGTPHCSIHA